MSRAHAAQRNVVCHGADKIHAAQWHARPCKTLSRKDQQGGRRQQPGTGWAASVDGCTLKPTCDMELTGHCGILCTAAAAWPAALLEPGRRGAPCQTCPRWLIGLGQGGMPPPFLLCSNCGRPHLACAPCAAAASTAAWAASPCWPAPARAQARAPQQRGGAHRRSQLHAAGPRRPALELSSW